MCDPVTVMGALSVAGTAMGAVSQYQQANASNRATEQTAQAQADEYADSRDQQLGERVRASRRERARIRVSAGESGVAGQSFEAQLRNSFGAQERDIAISKKQSLNTGRSLNAQVKAEAKSFSPLSAGLQIAGAGYKAYDKSRKAPKAADTSK